MCANKKNLHLKTIIDISYEMKITFMTPFNTKYSIKNKKKHLQVARYRKLSKPIFLSASLPICLTDNSHKARGQTKQSMATILCHNNKFTSGMCLLWFRRMSASVLCHSFYCQLNGRLLHARKPYQGINFSH